MSIFISTMLTLLVPLIAIALLATPLIIAFKNVTTKKRARRGVIVNLCTFGGLALLALLLPTGGIVAAAGEAATNGAAGMGYLAAAISTGLACLGAGLAVAGAAPAAVGAVSEDPKSFGKAMIFVVLGEGVAIYGMLISIMILNKL